MNKTIGNCSLCGGRVSLPEHWMSVNPPVPCCESCGARPKVQPDAVIEMEPHRQMTTAEMIRGLVRSAESKEQVENGVIWDEECRMALQEARRRGWGKNRSGSF